MTEPHVTAVCLTADRHVYTTRAVQCFLAQTYTNKSLLILDSGDTVFALHPFVPRHLVRVERVAVPRGTSIGVLRNLANSFTGGSDILCHWDSDDWSRGERIAQQVDQLHLSGGADVVGYSQMLFWDCIRHEAWLYTHPMNNAYCLGTSLCYWRRSWATSLFPPTSRGEYHGFVTNLKTWSCSAMSFFTDTTHLAGEPAKMPIMVAEIHDKNTGDGYGLQRRIDADEWVRTPQWDALLAEKLGMENWRTII